MTTNETILSVIPGTDETQRLIVVLRSMQTSGNPPAMALAIHDPDAPAKVAAEIAGPSMARTFCEELIAVRERPVVLRQQSFSPAVGWFTQSELEMTHDQWSMMRCTVMPASPKRISSRTSSRTRSRTPSATASSGLATRSVGSVRARFDQPDSGEPAVSVVPFSADQAASA